MLQQQVPRFLSQLACQFIKPGRCKITVSLTANSSDTIEGRQCGVPSIEESKQISLLGFNGVTCPALRTPWSFRRSSRILLKTVDPGQQTLHNSAHSRIGTSEQSFLLKDRKEEMEGRTDSCETREQLHA